MYWPSALAASPVAPGRLADDVVPTAEQVTLTLDPARPTYAGSVDVDLTVRRSVSSFALHAEGLVIDDLAVRCGRKDARATHHADGTRLVVDVRRPLPEGPCTLTIAFHGTFGTDVGLYRHVSEDGHAYLVTQLEPDEARTAWPCFDEPRFKIPWRLTIDAPASATVLTGGVEERATTGDTQRVTSVLAPLPSYLVALAVGPFVPTPFEGGARGTVWTLPGREARARWLATVAPRHLAFLESWFGSETPYPRADVVVVPRFTYGAMENPGLVVGVEDALLASPDATADERRGVSYVAAHELAHFWFGDLVTLAWWDELWLNEAMADWLCVRALAAADPDARTAESSVLDASASLAGDALPSARPLTGPVDPDHVFETANLFQAYSKGGAVLDAIEAWLGRDTFRDGVRRFVAGHAHGIATGRDLAADLAAASGQDVAPVFLPWVEAPGAPRLDFTRAADGAWSVGVSRFGGGDAPWTVPLTVRGPDGVARVLAHGPATPLPGSLGSWVLPTPDGIGYFAWTAPPDALRAVLAAPLSPAELVAVLADLERVREVGAIGLDVELAAFDAVRPTTPDAGRTWLGPWREVLAVVPEAERPAARELVRGRVRPLLAEIGDAPRPGEPPGTDAWRADLIELLGDGTQDPEVRARARALVDGWLAGGPLDRATAGSWWWVAARSGDRALQDALIGRLRATTDPHERRALARAIGGVPGAEAREVALALATSRAHDLPIAVRMAFVDGAFADESSHRERLTWAMAHHDELTELIPDVWLPWTLAGFTGGCDRALWEDGRAFYDATGVPGIGTALAQTGDGVAACVARRDREPAAFAAWASTAR